MTTDRVLYIVGTLLTIIGWFAAFWFGVRQQRLNTKDSAKLKVYEDIWKQRSILQNSSSLLSVQIQSGPPFILMESTAILGNVTKDQQHIWQGQQEALNHLNSYLTGLQNTESIFTSQFLDFWRSLEMWLHVMPKLETAIRTLTTEYATVQEKMSKLVMHLIVLDRQQWKDWDRVALKESCIGAGEDLFNLGAYTEDLMGLIHNELVSPMFKYTKVYRKPLDPRYKILTKGGLAAVNKD